MREFGEILGKYRMLDGRPVGSKGLKDTTCNIVVIGVTYFQTEKSIEILMGPTEV